MIYPVWWGQAENELDQYISEFTDKIKQKLEKLKPNDLIGRKNPYLFCLRATNDTQRYAEAILDAFLSSSEETMFGSLAEDCAVVICGYARNGIKSTAEGIDIEYVQDNTRTIIQVKSGKHWGNSSQRKKMEDYFSKARRILQQGGAVHVRCIEGICYGPASSRDRGNYLTYIGSVFWKEISEWDETYTALLDIFFRHAQNGLLEVKVAAREKIINFLIYNGISVNNEIQWNRLLQFVNGPEPK